MSIEDVPDIEETVHTGQEEQTGASWRPATVREVALVISGLHDWGLEVFAPNLGRPISNRHEVLKMAWVPLKRVNWSVMSSAFHSKSHVNFDLLSLGSL